MEILTYILDGQLAHKDSMGNGRVIKAGEVQGMSAGTGVTHSESNASKTDACHLLQIWIMPHTQSVKSTYSEWLPSGKKNEWAVAASEEGKGGAISIHQDAKMLVAVSDKDTTLQVDIASKRFGWLQIAKGSAKVGDAVLEQGDGVAFSGDAVTQITATPGSEVLLFDLA